MITDPVALSVYLIVIVGGLFQLSRIRFFARAFHYVPPVLWILLIPTLSSTFGLTPTAHPVYDWLQNYVLLAGLTLLLLATNLKTIMRLGRPALVMMLTASASISIGAILVFALLHPWLPPESYKAFGGLVAVWTGGYGNMLAVSASLDSSGAMLTNAIITDTVIGFGWMSVLITLAGFQAWADQKMGADRAVLDDLNQRLAQVQTSLARPITVADLAVMVGLAFGVAYLAAQAGQMMPRIEGVMTPFTWSVIAASLAAIGLSFTRLADLQYAGATSVGTVLLYIVYAAIGARADLSGIGSAPLFLLAGLLILTFHTIVMVIVGRLMRAPVFLLATASMANVGGMATAPIVSTVYQSSLAGVAVLIVPLGLAYGTFVALLVAGVCRLIAGG